MESNRQPQKSSCADYHHEVSSPVLRVVQVSDKGVVFESRESFEIGSWIELGFHIQPQNGRLEESEFISSEGMVVSCSYCSGLDGLPVHEITLLFGEMSDRDKKVLQRLTSDRRRSDQGESSLKEEPDFAGLN